jgi:hypothetical protein
MGCPPEIFKEELYFPEPEPTPQHTWEPDREIGNDPKDNKESSAKFVIVFVVLGVLALVIEAVLYFVAPAPLACLKAALVATELEERGQQTQMIGTATARALAAGALAVTFSLTMQSTVNTAATVSTALNIKDCYYHHHFAFIFQF